MVCYFDKSTSILLAIGYAIPAFAFAILLIVFFAGGSYFQWFPLQGLVSVNFAELSVFGKIADYFLAYGVAFVCYGNWWFCRLNPI